MTDTNQKLREALQALLHSSRYFSIPPSVMHQADQALAMSSAPQGEPVAWMVWWGLGEMRPVMTLFATKELAEAHASQIKSCTDVRPVLSTQPSATTPSPTTGMTLWERIQHVGGRQNAATYIEFGSVMAVQLLINHVLRDLPKPTQEVVLTDADIDAATRHLYHGGKPTSKEYRVGIVRAALRAKGSK